MLWLGWLHIQPVKYLYVEIFMGTRPDCSDSSISSICRNCCFCVYVNTTCCINICNVVVMLLQNSLYVSFPSCHYFYVTTSLCFSDGRKLLSIYANEYVHCCEFVLPVMHIAELCNRLYDCVHSVNWTASVIMHTGQLLPRKIPYKLFHRLGRGTCKVELSLVHLNSFGLIMF